MKLSPSEYAERNTAIYLRLAATSGRGLKAVALDYGISIERVRQIYLRQRDRIQARQRSICYRAMIAQGVLPTMAKLIRTLDEPIRYHNWWWDPSGRGLEDLHMAALVEDRRRTVLASLGVRG